MRMFSSPKIAKNLSTTRDVKLTMHTLKCSYTVQLAPHSF